NPKRGKPYFDVITIARCTLGAWKNVKTQSKASTLSSGVRAAAQTLNVPIERLESRQSNHREVIHASSNNGHNMTSSSTHHQQMRNASSPMMAGSYDDTHHHMQHSQQQQQQQQQQMHHHSSSRVEQSSRAEVHSRSEMHSSRSMHHSSNMHDNIDHHHAPVTTGQAPHHYNGHNEDDDRIIEREHYGGEHHQQYTKQQSYLHSGRKLSNQQYHGAGMPPREQAPHVPNHLNQQILDANYMAEDQHNGGGSTSPSVTRYSLLQFAMQHFRN
uniref:Uncharacterized protein n=1 Tax=Stomoxys calcitrans TaxID=35570 RepID=A0A1I8Q7E6_STOCA